MQTLSSLIEIESFWGVMAIPLFLSMFLAVNMGGSGTAPAFSAAYGAGVIRRTMIPALFGIMVLIGALLAGKEVSLTLGNGLLEQSLFTPMVTSIILLCIGLSLFLANLLGVPQSTSQSTVLAIAGAATALDGLNTQKLFLEILPTWFILPLVSFLIMLALSKWVFPYLKDRFFTDSYDHLKEHKGLKALLVAASLYVAFSIGANNVANAAAPIASLAVNQMGETDLSRVILYSMLLTAPCFAIGSSLFGHKVTKKNGKDIVDVNPFYACVISILVASLLLMASMTKGIPTSLVQLNGTAFIALGITKNGFRETFSNRTVKRFFTVWAVAPIFAFGLAFLLIKQLV
ncbi:inorganic phosphate transporter [Flagellimonas amoyensis]|uniref:inorganic phosphate transporter n=1 Tax=Flagellimonas amoyensis TaxID=2169401 RepID=UPI0019009600|nr:inorganic phosphate transporter [Allomuricauda amoyensis]